MKAMEARALAIESSGDRMGLVEPRELREHEHEKEGERYAGFQEAYLAFKAPIYAYIRRLMADEAEAEDLTVSAFEKALRAWDRRPSGDQLRPWLFRIATNACLDELRRRQKIRWQPWNAFISRFHIGQVAHDDPEAEVLSRESARLVREALGTLSPRDRAALVMREYHDLSADEIGQALGISRSAAKTTLFRARERLRTAYLQLTKELSESDEL